MKPYLRVFTAILAVCLLGTGCLSAHPATEGSFERTLSVSGQVDLDVVTGSGNIDVRAVGGSTVRVRALIRARDLFGMSAAEKVRYIESHPPIEQTGNVIRIGRFEDREYTRNVTISYELDVPPDTRLKARSGSGNVTAGGLNGTIEMNSGSGNVRASNIGGEVRAQTGSGNVEIDSVRGNLQAGTGSGNIRAQGIGGGLRAHSGSGSVHAEQTAPGDADLETGSGNIDAVGVRGGLRARTGSGRIDVGGEPSGGWTVNAGSGNVTIRLKSEAAFDLYAHTSSGHVRLDHPVTVTGTVSAKELRGKVRGGGPLVEAHTGSGDILVQ